MAADDGDGAELEHGAQLDDASADGAGGAVENHCDGGGVKGEKRTTSVEEETEV